MSETHTKPAVIETGEVLAEGHFFSRKACLATFGFSLSLLVFATVFSAMGRIAACVVLGVFAIAASFCGMLLSKRDSVVKFIVTDRCIYRKTIFGKHTYLPINSVRAVDMMGLGGICVRTAVGNFCCHMISNRDEVFVAIKRILDENQG